MDATRAADEQAPTNELLTGAVGDQCTNCRAPLASDQRYCVNCGERRGKPRFSYDAMATQSAPAAAPEPSQRRSRVSSGATLVAGVATLLLAMGVGVLIGHDNNSTPARGPQVITVGGAGSGTAGTGGVASSAQNATSGSSRSTRGKTAKAKATKVVHVTAKQTAAAASAASKALGSNSNLSSNPTQKQGGKCSGGAGCQNGTFTGNFFGQ